MLTIGELQRGVARVRRRDPAAASTLGTWLAGLIASHEERLLPIDLQTAREWGRLDARHRLPVVDGLLAATARVRDLVLVTSNVRDVERTGVELMNPFEPV